MSAESDSETKFLGLAALSVVEVLSALFYFFEKGGNMAGNIKGIKIEIDGDTQPLQKALKAINKESVNTTNELKQIDKALKFDTGNVILLTQNKKSYRNK